MNILIIEDEIKSAKKLINYLKEISDSFNIIGPISSVRDGIKYLKENKEPDLIFLDIQLADGDSFQIFEQVIVESYVIVISAFNDFALKAFNLNSTGYLTKPFTKIDIAQSLNKLERIQLNRHNQIQVNKANKGYRFLVKKGNRFFTLLSTEISHFYMDKVLYLVTMDGQKFIYESSLEDLENQLSSLEFFRVSRQCLINYQSIESIVPESSNRYKVKLKPPVNTEFNVSQGKSSKFKDWISR